MRATTTSITADMIALFEVISSTNDISTTVESMMREKDADILEALYNSIEESETVSVQKIDAFGTNAEALKGSYRLYDTEIEKVVEAILLGDNASARQAYIEKVTPLKAMVFEDILNLQTIKGNRMTEMVETRAKAATNSSMILGFLLAFFCLAIGISGLIIAKNITSSFTQVVSRLKEISEGDGDLTARLESRGNDEIAKLTRYFNAFTEKLSVIIKVVQTALQFLAGTSHDLVSNTEETAAAVNQISANVESFKK